MLNRPLLTHSQLDMDTAVGFEDWSRLFGMGARQHHLHHVLALCHWERAGEGEGRDQTLSASLSFWVTCTGLVSLPLTHQMGPNPLRGREA